MPAREHSSRPGGRALGWVSAISALLCLAAVVVLAFSGYPEAAAAVGVLGGAGAGGVRVSIHVRR